MKFFELTFVEKTCPEFDECISFIENTVLEISGTFKDAQQNTCYAGHSKWHVLKFQTVTVLEVIIIPLSGLFEGRRQDRTFYILGNKDQQLHDEMNVNDIHCHIHGNARYYGKVYNAVPFSRAFLVAPQQSAKTCIARDWVLVEWIYREIKLFWCSTDYKRKLKAGDVAVGYLYQAEMLLPNIESCICPHQMSQFLNCLLPSLSNFIAHCDSKKE